MRGWKEGSVVLNHEEPKGTKAFALLIGDRIYRINRMFVKGSGAGAD